MTYRRVEPGLGRLIQLGLDHELEPRVAGWKEHLAQGRMTTEMRDVFVAMGWLSSARDSRLGPELDESGNKKGDKGDKVEIDESGTPAEATIREPREPGNRIRESRKDDAPRAKETP